jgi:hypothetical protein
METTLDYQHPVRGGNTLRRTTIILLACAWLWTVAGLLFIVSGYWIPLPVHMSVGGIESIVFTGPILEMLGLAAFVTAIVARSKWLVVAAALPVTFPVFIFGLINYLHWGPSDANRPVTGLIVAYAVGSLIVTAFAARTLNSQPRAQ